MLSLFKHFMWLMVGVNCYMTLMFTPRSRCVSTSDENFYSKQDITENVDAETIGVITVWIRIITVNDSNRHELQMPERGLTRALSITCLVPREVLHLTLFQLIC
jgi:hypothetical protein